VSRIQVGTNEKAPYDQARWLSQWSRVSPNSNYSWQSQSENLRALWKEDG